jgi:hypothetical protein
MHSFIHSRHCTTQHTTPHYTTPHHNTYPLNPSSTSFLFHTPAFSKIDRTISPPRDARIDSSVSLS